MKNFCWRAGEPPRPLQTCSLRRLFATFRLVVQTRKSGLCALRTGRGQKCQNQYDFLTFGGFGDFCRPTGCQNFENRVAHLLRRGCFLGKARPKAGAWCGLSAPKAFFRPRMAAGSRPLPLLFLWVWPKVGKFSGLASQRSEISRKFCRNRHQRPEFALDLGFGQKVVFRAFLTHPSHRL